jgi:hypothetical protein
VLAGLFAGNAIAQQIDGHPDFSGLWTTYRGPTGDGGTRGGPAGQAGDVSLTPLAQEKVDAYRAVTEGTNHSPGAYCVGSGMPSSMVGAGGYPMEILVEQVDSRIPHSDQARSVGRYTLSEEDGRRVLTNEWTMTDLLFLEEPMSGVKRWQQVEGGRLMNYECTEPDWFDIVQRLLAGEEIGYQGE